MKNPGRTRAGGSAFIARTESRLDIMMPACQHLDVRTTLTLDADVAARLQSESRRSGRPFKDLVNEYLRRGMEAKRSAIRTPFVVTARPLGLHPGLDYDNIGELLEQIEGPQGR